MKYEVIRLERNGAIGVLTLNRPNQLNAVTHQMRLEIFDALEEIERDEKVRVLIFTGAGRGFCAGQDIKEFIKYQTDPELNEQANEYIYRLPGRIYELEKPTIGAINGVATGDGAQYVLAFDLNVASENARFGYTAAALGLL